MAFLDDLGKTLTDMGKDAAQKTKDVVDILQMKTQIATEKSKLRDLYAVIGKSYYDVHKEAAAAEHAETCSQIDSALSKIAELEEKISRLDNTVTCPACGAILEKGSAFCNHCGAAVVSAGQDLMVVGDDAFAEADPMFSEDVEKDTEKDVEAEAEAKTETVEINQD